MLPVPAGNMGVAGSIQSNLLNFSPVLGGRVFLCGGDKAGAVASQDLLVFDPAQQQHPAQQQQHPAQQQVPSSVDLDDHNL